MMGGPNISRILKKTKEIFDDINSKWIDSEEIGVSVDVFYPSKLEDCNNCELSDYGIVYKTGGIAPFLLGDCPVCGSSSHKKEVEVSETLKVRLYSGSGGFSKFNFKKLGISVDSPTGDFLLIGKISDLTKIKNANSILLYSNQKDSVGHIRASLSSEPHTYGFGKDRFFFCFLSRV
jgi:hypothetical protein